MSEEKVNPEVVAVIMAAVQAATARKLKAVRIHPSEAWKMSGRQLILH